MKWEWLFEEKAKEIAIQLKQKGLDIKFIAETTGLKDFCVHLWPLENHINSYNKEECIV